MKQDFLSSIIDLFKAFFMGIAYGFYDLIPVKKSARLEPIELNDSSWKKYFKIPEWRYFIVREITAQIVIVLVLLIVVRTTIGEFRYIPSESMLPTLKIGDKLFVEKISRLFHKEYQRGDIVIFFPPATASDGKDPISNDPLSLLIRLTGLPFLPQPEAYIKRLIGLPGDKIEIIQGDGIYINERKLLEPYHEGSPEFIASYNFGPVTVPQDTYLVLGDNRNFSYDSHYWGFLPKERVIGRAAFLIYRSLDKKPSFFDSSML